MQFSSWTKALGLKADGLRTES